MSSSDDGETDEAITPMTAGYLRPGEIHVRFMRYEAVLPADVMQERCASLSELELAQARRFHFEKDRTRYVLTRALVRSSLSRYAPVAPGGWQFAPNAFGRPEICNPVPEAQDVSFNVSHTDGAIVLAVSRARRIGIDIESDVDSRNRMDIAQRFFAPLEYQDLQRTPLPHQSRRFLEYWTLKEAYVKARGLGVSIPFNEFSFDLSSSSGIGFSRSAALSDATHWLFSQATVQGNFVVALCEDAVAQQPAPLWFAVESPQRESPLELPLTRHGR